MIVGFLLSVAIGFGWVSLGSFLMWRTGRIYLFIMKNGLMKETYDVGYKKYGVAIIGSLVIYLLFCDFLILRFDPYEFIVIFILNVGMTMLLLFYHSYVMVHWVLLKVRPLGYQLSKNLTQSTLLAFNQKTIRIGGLVSIPISMVCGFIYTWVASRQ